MLFTTNPIGGCGGLINLTSTQSKSFRTQQGDTYQPFEECHWTVVTSPDKTIQFNVYSMDIKNSINNTQPNKCSGDYLEVNLYLCLISTFKNVDNKIVSHSNTHIILQEKMQKININLIRTVCLCQYTIIFYCS